MVRRLILSVDTRSAVWAAVLGAAIVVLTAVPLSAALNIWLDEAFTLHTTGAGPAAAWAQSVAFEMQPPLYFLIEAAWRTMDETSIPFARLPSVLFAAAAVALIVGAGHRIAPRTPPVVVAVVTAVNPIVIWAAVELRVYALVLLAGAALTWTFFEGFVSARPSRRAQVAYALFALIGLYTQYYVGFVLAAHVLTLLVLRRGQLRAFGAAMAGVCVAFAPFVSTALRHVGSSGDFVERMSLAQAVHEIANTVFIFVLPHDPNWSGALKLAGFACAAGLGATFVILGRPVAPAPASRAIAAQWLVCLAAFSLLFAAMGAPIDTLRHVVVLVPSSLLVAVLFMSSLSRRRRLLGSIAVAAFAMFALTQFWNQYRPPIAKRGDWQRVATTLAGAGRDTPIAVFPPELAFPLNVYLRVATIPIPGPMPLGANYLRAARLTGEAQVARVLDPVQDRSERLWVVTGGVCGETNSDAYDYHCGILENFLNRRYRIVKSIAFHGALARLYVRSQKVFAAAHLRRHAN